MRVRGSRALPPDLGLGGVENGGEAGTERALCAGKDSTPAEGSDLPCQDSHKCTEGVALTPSAKRTAFALQENVAGMVERFGIERCGFLTLTFRDHVTCPKEAQRRMHSLRTHVLSERYAACITVMERQKSGRIHFHLLVAGEHDIRSGVDFDAIARGDYRSANAALRREWAFWRATAPKYRFGRTELLPVKSTREALSRYLGKYIAKHMGSRQDADRGVKLVRYVGPKVASTRFGWVSPGATEWRLKLAAFVQMLFEAGAISHPTAGAMSSKFGPRWVWKWRDSIMTWPLDGGTPSAQREPVDTGVLSSPPCDQTATGVAR